MKKFMNFIRLILLILTGFLIYNLSLLSGIENLLRLIICLVLVIIAGFFIILGTRYRKKKKKFFIVLVIMIIYIFGLGYVSYYINNFYGSLKNVTDSNYTTYSTSLVTLKENSVNNIDDIGNSKIGLLEDISSIEGYTIPKEIIKDKNLKNKTKEYSTYLNEIDALKAGKIKYIFLPSDYVTMFVNTDGYEDLDDITKIIYSKEKKLKKGEKLKNETINKPFTLLLMGVDSDKQGIANSTFNGDSLMLITFNPNTLSTTILSIPRDSYVPITCFTNQRKNKITHAAWQGEDCMMNTISNLLDVDIDYYVKINFKGVVELVDDLGGVDINVPYNLCEQNSSRKWGSKTVYIEKGKQTLTGEQALAYSRNRHANPNKCSSKWTNYNSNDFIRGQHQQEVVKALLNKLKNVDSLSTVSTLLKTISKNMTTNMSTSEILSLYNVVKNVSSKDEDVSNSLSMQRLYLNGYDEYIVDYGGTGLRLYNYVLYNDSVNIVSDTMKVNLGVKKAKVIKKFSFDVNKKYKESVVGKNVTGAKSVSLLPSFVGSTEGYARSFCSSNGISVNVKYVSYGTSGNVVSQSVASGCNAEDVNSITLTVSK